MSRIKVKHVTVERAEGPSPLPPPITVATLDAATKVLREWSYTAPGSRGRFPDGYDKCDFTVEFEDGQTYDGRYDLKRDLEGEGSLANHILTHVRFCAGLYCPPHLTPAEYQRYVQECVGDDRPKYEAFLNTYELGQP